MEKERNFLLNNSYLVILFFFSLISLVKIILSFSFPTPWIFSDEGIYDSIARNIFLTKSFSQYALTQIYPPGYSLFLSCAYFASPDKTVIYHAMLILNALITTLIIIPAYFILKKYTDVFYSLAGAVVVGTLPCVNLYTFTLMSENVFIPLTVFSFWFIIQAFEQDSPYWDVLAGFSVFYLFFTRSTGIAMVLGLFLVFVYYGYSQIKNRKGYYQIIHSKFLVIFSCVFPIIFWVLIKQSLPNSSVIGYDLPAYLKIFFELFLNFENLPSAIPLFFNEIGFLILASYFVMFFLTVCFFLLFFINPSSATYKIESFHHVPENIRAGLGSSMIYCISFSFILVFITLTHMYKALLTGDQYYYIFARYIDPIVPIIIIFGLIFLYHLQKNDSVRKRISSIIVFFTGVTLLFFYFFFPVTYYKFPNMLSLHYLELLQKMLPVWEIFLAFFVIVVVLLAVIHTPKAHGLFFIFLCILSLSIMLPAYNQELTVSVNTENANQIGRYLQKHSDFNTTILMDRQDFNSYWGPNMWYLTEFWSQGIMVRTSSPSDPSGMNSLITEQSDFIISKKILMYQTENFSTFDYKLYRVKPADRYLLPRNFSSFIDIGIHDEMYVENFHPAENNQMRWTKNYSRVLIEYPKECGSMNLSLKIGGHRPFDNPANVMFSINGHHLGNNSLNGNQTTISNFVPDTYLNDRYNILQIDTNTWNPFDYGSKDNRDLGIQVDWVYGQSNAPEKAEKYCNPPSV